jgi:hypothetical protein
MACQAPYPLEFVQKSPRSFSGHHGVRLMAGEGRHRTEADEHRFRFIPVAVDPVPLHDDRGQDDEGLLAPAHLTTCPLPSVVGRDRGRARGLHLDQELVAEGKPTEREAATSRQVGEHRLPFLARLQVPHRIRKHRLRLVDLLVAIPLGFLEGGTHDLLLPSVLLII